MSIWLVLSLVASVVGALLFAVATMIRQASAERRLDVLERSFDVLGRSNAAIWSELRQRTMDAAQPKPAPKKPVGRKKRR